MCGVTTKQIRAHVPFNTPRTGGVNWVSAACTNTSHTHPINVLLNSPMSQLLISRTATVASPQMEAETKAMSQKMLFSQMY